MHAASHPATLLNARFRSPNGAKSPTDRHSDATAKGARHLLRRPVTELRCPGGEKPQDVDRHAWLGAQPDANLRNIHGQCAKCNRFAAGMLVPYSLYLQKKYGPEIVQELYDLWRTPKKWTLEQIEAKRQRFEEAFNRVALHGLGVLRSDSGIENVAVVR
jgi:Bacteriophage Lambda NinG protein